jgi:hypothetical protein
MEITRTASDLSRNGAVQAAPPRRLIDKVEPSPIDREMIRITLHNLHNLITDVCTIRDGTQEKANKASPTLMHATLMQATERASVVHQTICSWSRQINSLTPRSWNGKQSETSHMQIGSPHFPSDPTRRSSTDAHRAPKQLGTMMLSTPMPMTSDHSNHPSESGSNFSRFQPKPNEFVPTRTYGGHHATRSLTSSGTARNLCERGNSFFH